MTVVELVMVLVVSIVVRPTRLFQSFWGGNGICANLNMHQFSRIYFLNVAS